LLTNHNNASWGIRSNSAKQALQKRAKKNAGHPFTGACIEKSGLISGKKL
jgi:hypothetical protein